MSFGIDFESDDIDYDPDIDLRSGGAMVDLYPFASGLRISAGARLNGNRGDVRATPTQPVEVGGTRFTPAQIGTITGDVEVDDVAPVVTLGYGAGSAAALCWAWRRARCSRARRACSRAARRAARLTTSRCSLIASYRF